MDTDRSIGEVVNVGNTEEITIEGLAQLVKERTHSASPIEFVPYDQAYEPGFEDMMRRVPCVDKLHALTGFRPQTLTQRNHRPRNRLLSPKRRSRRPARRHQHRRLSIHPRKGTAPPCPFSLFLLSSSPFIPPSRSRFQLQRIPNNQALSSSSPPLDKTFCRRTRLKLYANSARSVRAAPATLPREQFPTKSVFTVCLPKSRKKG